MSAKKGGIALPAVALYAVIAIVLILIGYSAFFFGFGFAKSKDVVVKAEQFQTDIVLINLLKTEISGKTMAETIMEKDVNQARIKTALNQIPGEQVLSVKRPDAEFTIAESGEPTRNIEHTAVLPSKGGIIEVKLYE